MSALPVWLALSLVLGSARAAAQEDSSAAAFLSRARAGSERYRDPSVALADGYYAVGPEAPAMGVHWVQPALFLAGSVDPNRPAILEYATIRGCPTLVGVAYALLLEPGEAPPDFPAGQAAWHSHAGGIEAEALRLTHEDGRTEAAGERVAVLHAWVWIPNPAGPFAPLNWALPYIRAGVDPAPSPGADARALSLDLGGAAFWEAALARALDANAHDAEVLHRVLAAYADTVARWRARNSVPPHLTDREREWLRELWERIRSALRSNLDSTKRNTVSMLTEP